MFSTRWLAWQVVASQYILEGYSISDNLAQATLQVYEFRKVLITYYIKVVKYIKYFVRFNKSNAILCSAFNFKFQSIIYYTIRSPKLQSWLTSPAIEDALQATQDRSFVDLDPIFNHNLDEDFDFRASGITRASFCSVYLDWIQFCYKKRVESHKSKHTEHQQPEQRKPKSESQPQSLQLSHSENFDGMLNDPKVGISPKSSNNQTPSPLPSKSDRKNDATAAATAAAAAAANTAKQNAQSNEIVSTQIGKISSIN